MTLTPKQALAKDGTITIKPGRGRLSREAKERCQWLVENKNWDIKGYSTVVAPAPAKVDKPSAEVKRPAGQKEVLDFTIFWPEDSYKAVGMDKAVWSMREVCNNCRVSLVQCACGSPVILGDVKVRIEAK